MSGRALRPAGQVMRLARLGASFPTRLSFMRVLLRRLAQEGAQVRRPVWEIDNLGFGRAVYSVPLGGFTYSLVAFSTPLDAANRTDRVIAEAWDTTYVLFDGVPDVADLDRLQQNAPKQEAGRFTPRELVLCRANRSVRMFDHVVACLSAGRQPSAEMVQSVGYLMRTTAVYGNGKFGIADRALIADRPGLSGPFAAEMLAVWLVRGFTHDLVDHVARQRGGPDSVSLDPVLKRHLGIGNATGLGMAPYLVNHPTLLNNWVLARETALARVRDISQMDPAQRTILLGLIARIAHHLEQWKTPDAAYSQRIAVLRREWCQIIATVTEGWLMQPDPWQRLLAVAEGCSVDCQELMVALVLEPNGDVVDDLAAGMSAESRGRFDVSLDLATARARIGDLFDWALAIDFDDPAQQRLFWYVSEEKQEPRLGDRYGEKGAALESPLDIARQVQALARDLENADSAQPLAMFLAQHPQHRYVARRVQVAADYPYSELHDNLIADTCLPIDMLRCKLAFFGAAKFDPKSDRWTRITLYQGAPLFDGLGQPDFDDWWLPVLEAIG